MLGQLNGIREVVVAIMAVAQIAYGSELCYPEPLGSVYTFEGKFVPSKQKHSRVVVEKSTRKTVSPVKINSSESSSLVELRAKTIGHMLAKAIENFADEVDLSIG